MLYNMSLCYTISEISKATGYYRIGVSKLVNSDERFKKTIKNGLVVFKSNLNLEEIKSIISQIKSQNRKCLKPRKAINKTS